MIRPCNVEITEESSDAYQSDVVVEINTHRTLEGVKAPQANDSLNESDAVRNALQIHLSGRVRELCRQKRELSYARWYLIQWQDDRSQEATLYWKLVFAAPSSTFDQYAFQLAYYLMEYQCKSHVRNMVEGVVSPCTETSWIDDRTTYVEQFIRERSESSKKGWAFDVACYILAAWSIGVIGLLSVLPTPFFKDYLMKKWMLQMVQEFSYNSVGYVFSIHHIGVFLQTTRNRLIFGTLICFFQLMLIVFPLVFQGNLKGFAGWPESFRIPTHAFGLNSTPEMWLVFVLLMTSGLFMCSGLAVVPRREEIIEQKKHLDVDLINQVHIKLARSDAVHELHAIKESDYVIMNTKDLLLTIVSQGKDNSHDKKRILAALMAIVTAGTGPCIGMYLYGEPFGTCEGGCMWWPKDLLMATKVIAFITAIPLTYVLQNMILLGLPYIWRKCSNRDRFLALVQGSKSPWVNADKRGCPERPKEQMFQIDMNDRNTLLGFGTVMKLLESQDNTEKRRTGTALGIVLVCLGSLTAWAFLMMFKTFPSSSHDHKTVIGWSVELYIVITIYLFLIVLPNGLRVNQIPDELQCLMADQLCTLAEREIISTMVQSDTISPQSQGGQQWAAHPAMGKQFKNSSKEETQHIQHTRKTLHYLRKSCKTVIFVKPFALLGIELTTARVGALAGTAISGAVALVSSVKEM